MTGPGPGAEPPPVVVDYGRLCPVDGPLGVVLVAQAAYHLDELEPLRDELHRRGVAASLLVPIPPTRPLQRFRPAVRRHRALLAAAGSTPVGRFTPTEIAGSSDAAVVMNDWGVPRGLVEAMGAAGRPTFGWVEGVQDFADVDTGQDRRPYARVDAVFCLGPHGARAVPNPNTHVVGSTRLRTWYAAAPVAPTQPRVTINSNFTYGVLTGQRRRWVRSAVGGCRDAGVPWVLSRHPAERQLPWPSRTSVSDLLGGSSHLVSRFSTLGYEALVRGVELVYHNPHGEREETFAEPRGAFTITRDRAGLAEALRRPLRDPVEIRRGAAPFLAEHLLLESAAPPASLAADVIVDVLGDQAQSIGS